MENCILASPFRCAPIQTRTESAFKQMTLARPDKVGERYEHCGRQTFDDFRGTAAGSWAIRIWLAIVDGSSRLSAETGVSAQRSDRRGNDRPCAEASMIVGSD
jgi:hypothetical protein